MSTHGKEFQIEPINKTLPSAAARTNACAQQNASVLEACDQFGLRKNVAFDRLFDVRRRRFRFQACLVIQRVELEKIMVRGALWRTWPAVADFAVIVFALTRVVWKFR